MGPYITEVFLVHLDLSDVRGVIGGVDFVLLLVIIFPIQTLRKGKDVTYEGCFIRVSRKSTSMCLMSTTESSELSYIVDDLVSLS